MTRLGAGDAERSRIFVAVAEDGEGLGSHLAVGPGALQHSSPGDAHHRVEDGEVLPAR